MVPPDYPLDRARLAAILERVRTRRIAVVGDFHLDVYWHADMRKARLSRETPHFARPVVRERYDPGVGGVVAANLCALGVGTVYAVGACGDDWRGQVLRERLGELGVDLRAFRVVTGRVTPTYLKPMIEGYESVQEDPRLDFQDMRDLEPDDEASLLGDLAALAPELHGIVVADQVEDEHGGTISPAVREALAGIGEARPDLPILADSRARIGLFRHVMVKVNRLEVSRALGHELPETLDELLAMGVELSARTGRIVFVSAGSEGIGYAGERHRGHVPAIPVAGPIDPVGAGDSASAGLTSALAAGASLAEAVALANMIAAVTVQKLGVTGTASPDELAELFSG
jgi:rfaE bifunctional protein kinase chain/domain